MSINSENMNVVEQVPIQITENALIQLNRIKEEQGIPSDFGLRVGVRGGGCSGFSYTLGFDSKKEQDQEFEIDGIKVFMEPAHSLYLVGMQIEWLDGLNNRGFSFVNPNAKETCGCGQSFSA